MKQQQQQQQQQIPDHPPPSLLEWRAPPLTSFQLELLETHRLKRVNNQLLLLSERKNRRKGHPTSGADYGTTSPGAASDTATADDSTISFFFRAWANPNGHTLPSSSSAVVPMAKSEVAAAEAVLQRCSSSNDKNGSNDNDNSNDSDNSNSNNGHGSNVVAAAAATRAKPPLDGDGDGVWVRPLRVCFVSSFLFGGHQLTKIFDETIRTLPSHVKL